MTEEINLNSETEQANETFEGWYEKLDEKSRSLLDGHIQGLNNSVKATRAERDSYAKQIKELTSKAQEGSELKQTLEQMSKQLEEANRRSDFLEKAGEVGCLNLKAAYALAVSENLFRRDGSPDWDAIIAEAPQLFEQKGAVRTKAGANATSSAAQKTGASMDDLIRNRFGGL